MIKRICLAVITIYFLSGCKSNTAFNYSQDVVKKEQSLVTDINTTDKNITDFINKEQYDSVAASGARMEKEVDARLQEIKDKPAPDAKGGADFKDAVIKYFQFIKSIYSGCKEFGNASTPEKRDEEVSKLRKLDNSRSAAISEMQLAQRKFAEANGFKIE